MTKSLVNETCEACRVDAPRLTEAELSTLLKDLNGWQVIEEDSEKRLQKVFAFSNFAKAMSFTMKVGALAEQANHHPSILLEWGRATVTWWTHKIGGLHRNDCIMAAKTDTLMEP